MDAVLVGNIATCVQPDDDLWIVGDFGFGKTSSQEGYLESIFNSLPGRKHLVIGNHDDQRVRNLPWQSVHTMIEVQDGDQRLLLCHYPMITWEGARRGAIQLFGHVHQNWRGTRNAVNVGVDVWGFMPIRANDAVKRTATQPVNVYWELAESRTLVDEIVP
jgi:calcineurin-like phosphoesterase family protein